MPGWLAGMTTSAVVVFVAASYACFRMDPASPMASFACPVKASL